MCFKGLMNEEVVAGRYCKGCDADVPYTRNCAFDRLPPALVLQFIRTSHTTSTGNAKNFRHVELTETLNMAPYVTDSAQALARANGDGGLLYRLVATVVHEGYTMDSGHYITYRRTLAEPIDGAPPHISSAGPEWEKWDDSDITAATWADVAGAPTYLAFYEVIDDDLLTVVFPPPQRDGQTHIELEE
jgi:hypothetical protein